MTTYYDPGRVPLPKKPPKIERPKKGKGSYRRKGQQAEPDEGTSLPREGNHEKDEPCSSC